MILDFRFYWKLFWRRLPVMMVFVLVCSTIGVITAQKLPETFSTTARMLVEAPQIPDELVRSTVQTDAVEQLDIIENRLLTRANLIDIANRFEVFEDIREMEPDIVVRDMRQSTRIRRTAGRNQATLMVISFEARTGQIAANVVNELVTLVLQENADFRTSRAENALAFFEQEVERLGADLDEQSTEIALFKAENVDALPEEQSYRLSRQTILQERLARLERERAAVLAQREELVRLFESNGTITALNGVQVRRTREEEQLLVAEAELQQALTVYSETHPRAIRLQSRVDRLEAIVTAQVAADRAVDAVEDTMSPQRALLRSSLVEIDNRLEFILGEITSTSTEVENLQRSIAASAANGIKLNSLERDYSNIQARYNAAVNNLNSARMSERIEITAQGQRISVIENASVPQVPTGPNRTKIIAAGLALGFGLAVGYFLLLEILNRAVRRPAELTSRFDITPLAVIPYMESRNERILRRGSILAATGFVLVAVPFVLWYIDANYLPLELVVQRGLARLGLG